MTNWVHWIGRVTSTVRGTLTVSIYLNPFICFAHVWYVGFSCMCLFVFSCVTWDWAKRASIGQNGSGSQELGQGGSFAPGFLSILSICIVFRFQLKIGSHLLSGSTWWYHRVFRTPSAVAAANQLEESSVTETARHGDDDDGVSRSHGNLVHRFAPSGCIDSRVIKKNKKCHARCLPTKNVMHVSIHRFLTGQRFASYSAGRTSFATRCSNIPELTWHGEWRTWSVWVVRQWQLASWLIAIYLLRTLFRWTHNFCFFFVFFSFWYR